VIHPTTSSAVLAIMHRLPPGTPDWFATVIFYQHEAAWRLPGFTGYEIPGDFDVPAAAAAITLTAQPWPPIP
jgi:hypothetical protein